MCVSTEGGQVNIVLGTENERSLIMLEIILGLFMTHTPASDVRALGSEDWHEREGATQRLYDLGPLAWPWLLPVLKSKDLEVSRRAETALATHERCGLLVDSSPKVWKESPDYLLTALAVWAIYGPGDPNPSYLTDATVTALVVGKESYLPLYEECWRVAKLGGLVLEDEVASWEYRGEGDGYDWTNAVSVIHVFRMRAWGTYKPRWR